jgi:hypothetical protein
VAYVVDPNNKELITSVETVNYAGKKVPPIIIFLRAYHLQKHSNNNIDSDIFWARFTE